MRSGQCSAGMMHPINVNNCGAFMGNDCETSQQLTHTLSFKKYIATNLNLNAVVGYEYLSFDTRWNSQSGTGFSELGDLDYYDYLDYSIASNRDINSYRYPTNELQSLFARAAFNRSEEHTSELQSIMRISYAVFCLKKNKNAKYK